MWPLFSIAAFRKCGDAAHVLSCELIMISSSHRLRFHAAPVRRPISTACRIVCCVFFIGVFCELELEHNSPVQRVCGQIQNSCGSVFSCGFCRLPRCAFQHEEIVVRHCREAVRSRTAEYPYLPRRPAELPPPRSGNHFRQCRERTLQVIHRL